MSLLTQCFGFLAVKPRVWVADDTLRARTSLATRIASLGAYDRWVTADKGGRLISIRTRSWWTWQPEEFISFDRVVEVDCSFNRLTRGRYPYGRAHGWRMRGTDQLEFFKVSLFLRDPQENVDLFWFWGEGAVETGATGVLINNDDVVDFSGDQRAASAQYAALLQAFIGARVHEFKPQGLLETLDRFLI
jgi:hypothetical protein